MQMRFLLTISIVFAFCLSEAGVAQSRTAAPPGKPGRSLAEKSQHDRDIVVVGTPDGPYPVSVNAKDYVELRIAGQQAAEDAHFFSRCVKPFDNGSLHELVDGPPNRDIRAAALNRIIEGYMACYPGYDAAVASDPGYGAGVPRDYGTCNPRATRDPRLEICRAFYDRGALVEMVLKTYAPDLAFTTQQLFQPAVLQRYHDREDRFNKTRGKGEIAYAEVAACVVALHPDSALALLHSDLASKTEGRLRSMLLGTSPQCTGGAKRVTVDPSQFRIFLADAIYSWAIALRDVKSLIPYSRRSTLLP